MIVNVVPLECGILFLMINLHSCQELVCYRVEGFVPSDGRGKSILYRVFSSKMEKPPIGLYSDHRKLITFVL